jgi:hypothetical protein
LHKILGEVRCKPDGKHLIALVSPDPVPLLRAAGIVSWTGSGGLLPVQATPLLRQHSVELSTT